MEGRIIGSMNIVKVHDRQKNLASRLLAIRSGSKKRKESLMQMQTTQIQKAWVMLRLWNQNSHLITLSQQELSKILKGKQKCEASCVELFGFASEIPNTICLNAC